VFKVGRRLSIKLLNASRFALGLGEPTEDGVIDQPLDMSMLTDLARTVREATEAFEQYSYTKALEVTETFFWSFCDDHLELVKGRAYGAFGDAAQASAQAALRLALDTMLRLFAPFLPFVTEEIWSWWREGSVHRASWPDAGALVAAGDGDPLVGATASVVLAEVRKAKTAAKRSMRWDVEHLLVRGPQAEIDAFGLAAPDVREAGRIASVTTEVADDADELTVEVVLSAEEQTG
jgi:valyl-tRNA synthetase